MDGPSEECLTNKEQKQPTTPLVVGMALGYTANTSDKYVPHPSAKAILADHIEMLESTRFSVRQQAQRVALREISTKELEEERTSTKSSKYISSITKVGREKAYLRWIDPQEKEDLPRKGFGTKLFDTSQARKSKPSLVDSVENFFNDFETITNSMVNSKVLYEDTRTISRFDKDLSETLLKLKKEKDWTLVPTDKTNGWIGMEVRKYIEKMNDHITKKCVEVNTEYLKEVEVNAQDLMKKHKHLMDDRESNYLEQWIGSKQIPTPRLLVKDHKEKNSDGEFPSRLLIPATNFTQCFAKMGYKIIKRQFDARNVQYNKHTLKQARCLKKIWRN